MIKILITGDFCPIGKVEKLSLEGKHDAIYNDLLPLIKEADMAITNLECPLFEGQSAAAKYGPVLKAPLKTAQSLSYGGFDVVTLANNHIMDCGAEGLASTIKAVEELGINHVGTGNNLAEARKPLIKEVKGQKIGILNFAENEFSNTHGDEPGANPLSLAGNFNDIRACREIADKVIVIVHGGNETYNLPSPRFKETLRFFADCGADAVIAHHTHVVSGYEVHNGVPVFYGIGNFIFDYDNQNNNLKWSTGIAVELVIGDKVSFNIHPFYQNKGTDVGVHLLKGEEHTAYLAHLEELNRIISNDGQLQKEFQKFIKAKTKQYSHFLEPYDSKILHGLYGRKIIPSFYSENKKRLMLNLIRCESHRDIVINILSE